MCVRVHVCERECVPACVCLCVYARCPVVSGRTLPDPDPLSCCSLFAATEHPMAICYVLDSRHGDIGLGPYWALTGMF